MNVLYSPIRPGKRANSEGQNSIQVARTLRRAEPQRGPLFPPQSPQITSLKASQQHTVARLTPRNQSTAKPCLIFIVCELVKLATKAIIESLEFFRGAGSVYARGLSLTVKTFRFKRASRYGCAALELPACPARAGTLHVAVHSY